jgi:ribonuclease P protein component
MFSPRKSRQNKAMSHEFRFKKSQRILKSEEFEPVLQRGLRREVKDFILFFLPNGRSENRMGTIITRKVGGAVKRNAIKRRLREYFRSYHTDILEDLPSHDIVFIAKRNSGPVKPKMIGEEMREFYEKNRDLIHHRLSTNRVGSSAQ